MFKFLGIIIFSLIISISHCDFENIYNLTEKDFIKASKATKNSKVKWLMIFETFNFTFYDQFLELLKDEIYPHYEFKKNIKFGLLDINSKELKWLINLLDFKNIPFLILVKRGRMYYFNDEEINQKNIFKFIDEKKSIKDSYPIIDDITLLMKGKILYNMTMNDMNFIFQSLFDYLDIKIKWTNKMSLLFVLIIAIILVYLEAKIIKLLCCKYKDKDENNEKGKEILNKEENSNKKSEDKNVIEENKENIKEKIE